MEEREDDQEPVVEDKEQEEEEEITFQILVGGSLRGRCKLKDSKGYTYTVKRENEKKTWWVCSRRSKTHRCAAAVTQCGDDFFLGRFPHDHPPIMKRFSLAGIQRAVEDSLTKLTTDMLDESGGNMSPISIDDDDSDVQSLDSRLHTPNKRQRLENSSPGDVQQELLKIEQERLRIEKQRLAIEKQRLVVEKQKLEKTNKRLEIEKERLEEAKKHTSQCMCVNRTESLTFT